MAVTVMEALENADYNLQHNSGLAFTISLAKNQLHNAIVLLNKGYSLSDEVEPLLDKYGDVDSVPEKIE